MLFPALRTAIRRALALLDGAPEVAGALLTEATPAHRGMVPCLDHAGRRCIHCAKDEHGNPSGYLPEPVSAVGWTDRAHGIRLLAQRAQTAERRAHLLSVAAEAWATAIPMAPPVSRGNLLDQAVRDYTDAGNEGEAATLLEEFSAYASDFACSLLWTAMPDRTGAGVGERVKLRAEALLAREEERRLRSAPLLYVEVEHE